MLFVGVVLSADIFPYSVGVTDDLVSCFQDHVCVVAISLFQELCHSGDDGSSGRGVGGKSRCECVKAKIISLRVFGKSGAAGDSGTIAAIQHVVENVLLINTGGTRKDCALFKCLY